MAKRENSESASYYSYDEIKRRKLENVKAELEIKLDRILDDWINKASIIGKFISEERVSNSLNLGEEINKAWPVDNPCEIHEIGYNLYFFVFKTIADRLRVTMSEEPWVINGKLLVIKELPDRSIKMTGLSSTSFHQQNFWVQVYGTDLKTESVSDILEQSGLFNEIVDADPRYYPSFLRFKVSVVLRNPLPTGFFLRSSDGNTVPITFKYENLPDLCPCCGILGHDANVCWVTKDRSIELYNDSLRGDPQEPLGLTYVGQWDGTYQLPKKEGYSQYIENMEKAVKGRRSMSPFFFQVKYHGGFFAAEERSRSEKGKLFQRILHTLGLMPVIDRL